jgi:hypothetical protein
MSEVCVTYIHRVFCIVNEETGEIDRVLSGEDLALDEDSGEAVYDLDLDNASPAISLDSERGQKAVEIAETQEWPAWDF